MNTILVSLCVVMPALLEMSEKQANTVCKYENVIIQEANKNNIEPELLASLIYVESSFRTRVVSSANACGLTQVVPRWTGGLETGRRKYTCSELKNPKTSIKVGAQILGYVIKHYTSGNVPKALCMYNAGTKCLKKKNFYKKLFYVKKVRMIYDTITDGC